MKWTAFCETCRLNLVWDTHGVVGILDGSIVEKVALEHIESRFDHHVIVGYYIKDSLTVPKTLLYQKGENNHGESERQQL